MGRWGGKRAKYKGFFLASRLVLLIDATIVQLRKQRVIDDATFTMKLLLFFHPFFYLFLFFFNLDSKIQEKFYLTLDRFMYHKFLRNVVNLENISIEKQKREQNSSKKE